MDFARILDSWEHHNKGIGPSDSKEPENVPPRRQMESAPVDARLDLHGLSSRDAEDAVRQFLGDGWRRGLAKVLIIHGQGRHSEDQRGVLRDMVRGILRKDRHVASWGQAEKGDGGGGASWVWLRGPSARGK